MTDGELLVLVVVAAALLLVGWPRRGWGEPFNHRVPQTRTPMNAPTPPRLPASIPPYVRRYEGTPAAIAEQYLADIGFTDPREPRSSHR